MYVLYCTVQYNTAPFLPLPNSYFRTFHRTVHTSNDGFGLTIWRKGKCKSICSKYKYKCKCKYKYKYQRIQKHPHKHIFPSSTCFIRPLGEFFEVNATKSLWLFDCSNIQLMAIHRQSFSSINSGLFRVDISDWLFFLAYFFSCLSGGLRVSISFGLSLCSFFVCVLKTERKRKEKQTCFVKYRKKSYQLLPPDLKDLRFPNIIVRISPRETLWLQLFFFESKLLNHGSMCSNDLTYEIKPR